MFVLGSNEVGQLGLDGEFHAKAFKRLCQPFLGPVRASFCINDSTFLVNREEEVFFCGRISHKRTDVASQDSQ